MSRPGAYTGRKARWRRADLASVQECVSVSLPLAIALGALALLCGAGRRRRGEVDLRSGRRRENHLRGVRQAPCAAELEAGADRRHSHQSGERRRGRSHPGDQAGDDRHRPEHRDRQSRRSRLHRRPTRKPEYRGAERPARRRSSAPARPPSRSPSRAARRFRRRASCWPSTEARPGTSRPSSSTPTSPFPRRQAVVVPIALTKLPKGVYGLRALVTIPKIAAGAGSLSSVDLSLRKQVATTGGKKHGYLLAKCSDGNFVFEPEVEFEEGSGARGLLAFGCTPKGRPAGK